MPSVASELPLHQTMLMVLFAAMVAMLLSLLVMAMKPAAFAMLATTFIALLLRRRRGSSASAQEPIKLVVSAGVELLVGLATLVLDMYFMIDAELSPTREAVPTTKEIERFLAHQDQDDRFDEAQLARGHDACTRSPQRNPHPCGS